MVYLVLHFFKLVIWGSGCGRGFRFHRLMSTSAMLSDTPPVAYHDPRGPRYGLPAHRPPRPAAQAPEPAHRAHVRERPSGGRGILLLPFLLPLYGRSDRMVCNSYCQVGAFEKTIQKRRYNFPLCAKATINAEIFMNYFGGAPAAYRDEKAAQTFSEHVFQNRAKL